MVDDMTSKELIAGANTPAKSLSSSHPLIEVFRTSIPFVGAIACALVVVVVIVLVLKRARTLPPSAVGNSILSNIGRAVLLEHVTNADTAK